MDFGKLFDAYSWQARMQPALATLFPLFISIAVWFPALYQLAAGLVSLATACGVTVLLSHYARVRGRKAEKVLVKEWGEKPSTIWLRHHDNNLDPQTKARYHSFLEANVSKWHAPTPEEEKADPADATYATAVRWLREHTRNPDAFPLVFKENVSYGFRRNLFGLKPLGVSLALFCVVLNLGAVYWSFDATTGSFNLAGLISTLLSALFAVAWLFVVNPAWVRDGADAYARALLASCDGHPKS